MTEKINNVHEIYPQNLITNHPIMWRTIRLFWKHHLGSHPAPLKFACVCHKSLCNNPTHCQTWQWGEDTGSEHMWPPGDAPANSQTYPGPAHVRFVRREKNV